MNDTTQVHEHDDELDEIDEIDDHLVEDDPPDLLRPAALPWRRRTAIEMVVSGGLIGLYTSFVLSIEALTLAADKDAKLSCDLNSFISCGTVAKSWQAELFGFPPNAFLGIAAEAVVITLAVALIGGRGVPALVHAQRAGDLHRRPGVRVVAVPAVVLRDRRAVPVVPADHRDDDARLGGVDPHQRPGRAHVVAGGVRVRGVGASSRRATTGSSPRPCSCCSAP